jgi:hypothetical protein
MSRTPVVQHVLNLYTDTAARRYCSKRFDRVELGTSVNPVPDVEHVLVTAGTGVPTSGLILG